jgi:phenylalanyl-tRNA synthetase beta subunit
MIRVRFQSMETTLTEEQISGFSARIVSILQQNLGAVLRAS